MNLNDQSKKPQNRKQQLLWFIGLWAVGVVGMAAIAGAFRFFAQFAYQ